MPSAIIADDEDLQRTDLRRMLAKLWPDLQILADCEDGGDALEAIVKFQPDIAFLDIRMPELTGLDVARASEGKCRVVFTTAYDNHAIEAFKLGALDYLLKPITEERLSQTLSRIQNQITSSQAPADIMRVMAELDKRLRDQEKIERIRWISASIGKTIKIIPIEEVLFMESDLRYTKVVTLHDEALVRTPLKELQKGLDAEQFWQIHRSSVVNAAAIERARRDDFNNIVVDIRGRKEQLKVSQTYAWRFKGM
jgi:DNA-binding LytR/AlgR family response regulator